jgi:type IV pilus assembly protein PilW
MKKGKLMQQIISTNAFNARHRPIRISAKANFFSNIIRAPARFQSGMTLVEIMIALLIGAFLVGGVIQLFLESKQSYRMTEGQSRIQENARYAIELLNNDIRMSGFQGCPSVTAVIPTNSASAPIIALTAITTITGYEGSSAIPPTTTWAPVLSATLTGLPTAGTDVITVVHGSSCGGYLTANMASTAGNISIPATNTCGVTSGDAFLVSDCNSADIFRATAGSNSTTIAHAALSKAYTTSAEVFNYQASSYFIQPGASGQPALFRLDHTKNTNIELIEGVEDMQILYGEDTDATPDGTPNYYVPANSIVSMAKVVSIRISLLLRSLDNNLTSAPQAYTYNSPTYTRTTPPAGDRRIRQVFNTTIAVRNRLL